jgi:hypothetical protein
MTRQQSFEFDPRNFVKSFFEVAKCVFFSPKPFFASVPRVGGIGNPALFMGACVVVHTFFTALGTQSAEIAIKNFILGISFPFFTAWVFFFLATKVFQSVGSYEMAFRVSAYAATLSLLSWAPVIGLVLEAYRLYLLTIGLSIVFELKISRAVGVILLTLVVIVVVAGALAHVTGGTLFQRGS